MQVHHCIFIHRHYVKYTSLQCRACEWSALAVLFDKALLKANICPSRKFPEAKPPKSVQGGPRDDGTVGAQGGAQETGAGSCNEQLSGDQTKNQSVFVTGSLGTKWMIQGQSVIQEGGTKC